MNSILQRYATVILMAGTILAGLLATRPALPEAENASAAWSVSDVEFWKYEDLISLDPWGDSVSDVHDLIAVYEKENSGLLYFRADVMDAVSDAKPDLFFAIDYKPGGNSVLSPGHSRQTDIKWDLLLSLSSTGEARVLDGAFTNHPEFLANAAFDTTLDYTEIVIHKEALLDWDGTPFKTQVLAIDKKGAVYDVTSPEATDAKPGRGKLVFVFNVFPDAENPGAIGGYDGFSLRPQDHPGERRGYKYLLDAAEKYNIPLTPIDLRVDILPGLEYLGVNDRLRELVDRGLLDPVTVPTYGYYMPWQPADVDALALRLAHEQREAFDLPLSSVYYPYETWLTAGDLSEIHSAGFSAIYSSCEKYGDWFGWPKASDWQVPEKIEGWYKTQRKIHMINGVQVFFGLQGFFPDRRWNSVEIKPGWYLQHYDSFVGTDGGLHHAWRRILLDMALDTDQEQYISMGTDLWLTSWVFQSDVERSVRWLAAHPWIEVTTYRDLITRNWTPVDHGDLSLSPNQSLDQYEDNKGHSAFDYFWQYYYGGISNGHSPLIPAGEHVESYFDYVPYLNGQPIPSGMKMGDDKTPGTIIYETLRNLRTSPDNSLTRLAWYAYFLNVAEQTFHASKLYESGENAQNDQGGRFLHPRAKAEANHIRQVNKIVTAAQWTEQTARGETPKETQILRQDLDLDGEDEFVLKNDRVFAIFENDGGRLEYAFSYSSSGGVLQWVGPSYQFQIQFQITENT